jgi:hypothetical protein
MHENARAKYLWKANLSAQFILEYFGEVSTWKRLEKRCWKLIEGAMLSSWGQLSAGRTLGLLALAQAMEHVGVDGL